MIQKTSIGNKLNGFYRGVVLKHLECGKCKIWIPGVYPEKYGCESKCANLPDAQQAGPIFGGANSNGNGVYSYPRIGSFVWCFFENEDQNHPVYFASCVNENETHMFDTHKHKISIGKIQIDISDNPDYDNNEITITVGNSDSTKTEIIVSEYRGIVINTMKTGLTSRDNIDVKTDKAVSINGNQIGLTSALNTKINGNKVIVDVSQGRFKSGFIGVGYKVNFNTINYNNEEGEFIESLPTNQVDDQYIENFLPYREAVTETNITRCATSDPNTTLVSQFMDSMNNAFSEIKTYYSSTSVKNRNDTEYEAVAQRASDLDAKGKIEMVDNAVQEEAYKTGEDPGKIREDWERSQQYGPTYREDAARAMEELGLDPNGMPSGPPSSFISGKPKGI